MQRSSSILLCLLALSACKTGPTTVPGSKPAKLTCEGTDVPTELSLVAAPKLLRRFVRARAERGIFGVRAEREGCVVHLEPVAGCDLALSFSSAPQSGALERRVLRTGADVVEHAAVGSDSILDALEEHGAIRLERQLMTEWALDEGTTLRARHLKGAECDDATHLVTAVWVGRFRLFAGKPKTPSFKTLGSVGYGKDCAEGSTSPRCSTAVAVALIPFNPDSFEADPLPEMVSIPKGAFVRGDDKGRPDEAPERSIELDAFEIDRFEVTARDYDACVAAGGCKAAEKGPGCNSGVLGKETHPINCIDHDRAKAYCEFKGKRLPTEAEWEKAARGPKGRLFAWGKKWPPKKGSGNFADRAAWNRNPHWRVVKDYDDGFAETAPVDAFGDAEKGPVQMSGNVAEWVADWYQPRSYKRRETKNPQGPSKGEARVLRGGSYAHGSEEQLRLTRRDFYLPGKSSRYFGVRCARSEKE